MIPQLLSLDLQFILSPFCPAKSRVLSPISHHTVKESYCGFRETENTHWSKADLFCLPVAKSDIKKVTAEEQERILWLQGDNVHVCYRGVQPQMQVHVGFSGFAIGCVSLLHLGLHCSVHQLIHLSMHHSVCMCVSLLSVCLAVW